VNATRRRKKERSPPRRNPAVRPSVRFLSSSLPHPSKPHERAREFTISLPKVAAVEIRGSHPATTSGVASRVKTNARGARAWIYDILVSSSVRIFLYCKPYRTRGAVLKPTRASRAGNIDFSIKRASQLGRLAIARDRRRSPTRVSGLDLPVVAILILR